MTQEQLRIAYQELANCVMELLKTYALSKPNLARKEGPLADDDYEARIWMLGVMLERHRALVLDKPQAFVNSVIQLNPPEEGYEGGARDWGPLLAIVEEVKPWGVQCYAFQPTERGNPPGQIYLRVKHGEYTVIGHAEWAAVSSEFADQQQE